MARKRTGLRNKWRTGRSTYSQRGKSAVADDYGTWVLGRCTRPERIAGQLSSPRRNQIHVEEL